MAPPAHHKCTHPLASHARPGPSHRIARVCLPAPLRPAPATLPRRPLRRPRRWIDFQHGPFTKVPALNPTFVCNHAWWTNPFRYGSRANRSLAGANGAAGARGRDRPFIMGRWGGLGGHRYPVGFAGDPAVKWKVLRYET